MHGVVQFAAGVAVDPLNDIARPVSLLMSEQRRFPSSGEVAYVIGSGTALAGFPELAVDWCRWTRRCAELTGDLRLGAASIFTEAVVALASSRFAESNALVDETISLANQLGWTVLASRAASMSGLLSVLLQNHQDRPDTSDLVLPVALGSDPILKVNAQITMALRELLDGRRNMTMTWLRSAMASIPDMGASRSFTAFSAPLLGTLLFLTGSYTDTRTLCETTSPSLAALPHLEPVRSFLYGIAETDLELALEHFREASSGNSSPMIKGQAALCTGLRLADASRTGEAQPHLERARAEFEALEASGLVRLVELELAFKSTVLEVIHEVLPAKIPPSTATGRAASAPCANHPTWELSLLGGFSVYQSGAKVQFPPSRAAQALKILAIRKKISVDQLTELLWPETEPGVGSRRLRNILWRIRGACGDLLERDGSVICLSAAACTDIAKFEDLASRALTSDCPDNQSAILAEQAIALYTGNLLPDDIYADWAGDHRESLSRLYVRLLDLCLAISLEDGRLNDSLALLERLIDAEPYEESYYLQASEIYEQSGHRYRARHTLERCTRMLEDLEVSPCPALLQAMQRLSID
jgi:DNA-binding SARP family transcriptional activator